jgi:hypothetical protein
MVGSVIQFTFPHLGLGFFFSTYSLLIKDAVRNYRKMLAQSYEARRGDPFTSDKRSLHWAFWVLSLSLSVISN